MDNLQKLRDDTYQIVLDDIGQACIGDDTDVKTYQELLDDIEASIQYMRRAIKAYAPIKRKLRALTKKQGSP